MIKWWKRNEGALLGRTCRKKLRVKIRRRPDTMTQEPVRLPASGERIVKRSALHYTVLILTILVLAIALKPEGKFDSEPVDDAQRPGVNRADPDTFLAEVVSKPNTIDAPADDEPPTDDATVLIARDLKTIRERLNPALVALGREAKIESSDHSLIVTYLPQKYSVRRPANKSGTRFYEPRDEVGPAKNGLILSTYVEPAGAEQLEQLVIPSILHEPLWLAYIDISPIKGTDQQISWSVDYNTETDRQLLDNIRAAMKSRGADFPYDALR